MNPATHLLTGWLVANAAPMCRRDRALVAISAVVPDVDGLGIVADFIATGGAGPLHWWFRLHHAVGHNLAFGVAVSGAAYLVSRRPLIACLAFLSFHTHLLGDLVGSRGPGEHQWAIPYLAPFSGTPQLLWDGQWALNAWPNIVITIVLLAATLFLAWRRGYSPVEMLSRRADKAFVKTLRNRFGTPVDRTDATAASPRRT